MLNYKRKKLNYQEKKTLKRLNALKSDSCDAAASFQLERMCHIHRGVCPGTTSTLFGNDAFGDDLRSQVQVCKLVDCLDENGIEVLGFGLDEEEITWALEVDSSDHELLFDLVWEAWLDAVEEIVDCTGVETMA